MDDIQSEVFRDLERLSIGNDVKSELRVILASAFIKNENRSAEKRQEKQLEIHHLESLIRNYEGKIDRIWDEVRDLEQLSDLGASTLAEAIHWFRDSVQNYEQGRNNEVIIDPIQLDASRILYAVENRIATKFQSRNFDDSRAFVEFENLSQALKNSIDEMNSVIYISMEQDGQLDDAKMTKLMYKIGENADNMLKFLKNTQKQQWKKLKDMLDVDASEERLECSERTSSIEQNVEILIEKFLSENRDRTHVPVEEARNSIIDVNNMWKNSFDQELITQQNNSHKMYVEFEKRLAEWDVQRRLQWTSPSGPMEPSCSTPRSVQQTPKKEKVKKVSGHIGVYRDQRPSSEPAHQNCNGPSNQILQPSSSSINGNGCISTGIIRHTIHNFSKLNSVGEESEIVTIGGFQWKTKLLIGPAGALLCNIFCNSKTTKWECNAEIEVRVLKQRLSGIWHSEVQTKLFNPLNKTAICMIQLRPELRQETKINDKMMIETGITILPNY